MKPFYWRSVRDVTRTSRQSATVDSEMGDMVKHGTCNVCGRSFTYEHEGRGRLRRYCNMHKCVSKGDSSRIRVCLRCGKALASFQKAKWCCSCKPIIDAEAMREARKYRREHGISLVVSVPDEKQCRSCGEVRPASEFNTAKDRPDGLQSQCKRCAASYYKQKRESMPKQPMKNRQPYKRTLNGLFCKVCGTELVGTQKNVCSDRECDLEYNRRRSYGYDSAKKVMKPRQCKECRKRFIPEYGNKRRTFCSEECRVKYGRRVSKAVRKARLRGVTDSKIEWIDTLFICERDGWRCYLCGVKTPKKLRGTCEHNAPEVDHVIPVAR